MSDPFGHAAGVYEHQRGVMLLDHLGDFVEQFSHHLGRWECFEFTFGEYQLKIEMALMAGINNGAVWCTGGIAASASDKHAGNGFDGPLGRRQPNTYGPIAADVFEPFQCEREV